MEIKSTIYYCHHCKKIVASTEKLYFVEEGGQRCFCSQNCIEQFYAHLVDHYKKIEIDLRERLSLQEESCLKILEDPQAHNVVFNSPDEIWCLQNELLEQTYCFIAKMDHCFIVALCFVFDWRPSFLLLATATASEQLLNEFRLGEKIEDRSPFLQKAQQQGQDVIALSAQTLETVGQKHASLLADLMEKRTHFDIPYESFSLYESSYQETLEKPDEVFSRKDHHGDDLITFVKAYELSGQTYYYFVICLKTNDQQLLPALSFPSIDGKIYEFYTEGKQVGGSIKS